MSNKIGKVLLAFEAAVIVLLLLVHYETTNIMQGFQKIKTVEVETKKSSNMIMQAVAVSKPRVIEEEVLIKEKCYNLTEQEYTDLLRIVEAEATGEDIKGKMLVANVVLNRVKSSKFPNSVTDVVYQCSDGKVQFSPVADGRMQSVKVSDETIEAVERVLYGADDSEGALYFVAADKAEQEKYNWFRTSLEYLFTHGGHEFYK